MGVSLWTECQRDGRILDVVTQRGSGSRKLDSFHGRHMCVVFYWYCCLIKCSISFSTLFNSSEFEIIQNGSVKSPPSSPPLSVKTVWLLVLTLLLHWGTISRSYLVLKKVKRMKNYVSKCNLYLYFLLMLNLLISGKKMTMLEETKGCVTWHRYFWIFFR